MHTTATYEEASQSVESMRFTSAATHILQHSSQTGECSPSKTRNNMGGGPCERYSIHTSSHHKYEPMNVSKTRKTRSSRHYAQTASAITRSTNITLLVVFLIACLSPLTSATPTLSFPSQIFPPSPQQSLSDLQIQDSDNIEVALAQSGVLLIDTRPDPLQYLWASSLSVNEDPATEVELRRRQSNGDPFSNNSGTTSAAAVASTTVASSTSKTTTTSAAATTTASSSNPLPVVFDSSIGANFTSQTCPDFINGFLQNATFKACLPFSLLLKNSVSFFQASKSLVRITQVLDATCAANMTFCTTYLNNIAANLTTSANCGSEYATLNPIVTSARIGLIAYKPMYQASCLKNPSTSSYCYADAITNSSSFSDSYIYDLALNESLIGGARPTCNACLQNTMAVLDANAANRSQPISNTYISAANMINAQCGPGFVNATLPTAIVSSAGSIYFPGTASLLALVLCVGTWLL